MPPKRTKKKKPSSAAAGSGPADELEAEVREAWDMFVDPDTAEDVIPRHDVRKVLLALGLESSREELREILDTLDPDEDGMVGYAEFLGVAVLKMKYKDTQDEVERAYRLFTNGGDGPIKLKDLRRVADELKEEITDEELKDMLEEACTRDVGRGVDLKDFENVMRRAGAL